MKKQSAGICSTVCLLSCLSVPIMAGAAEQELKSSLSTGVDIEERTYGDSRETRTRNFYVMPGLSWRAVVENDDFLAADIFPKLVWEQESGDTTLELSKFQVQTVKHLSEAWSLTAGNSFHYTDKAEDLEDDSSASGEEVATSETEESVSGDELSDDVQRTAFWNNTASLQTTWVYGEDGRLSIGGSVDLLRDRSEDEESGYDEYNKYSVTVTEEHRFNSSWGTTLSASATVGTYPATHLVVTDLAAAEAATTSTTDGEVNTGDDTGSTTTTESALPAGYAEVSDDVTSYSLSNMVTNYYDDKNRFHLKTDLSVSDYKSEYLDDNLLVESQLRWEHFYGPNLSTVVGVGPSYQSTSGQDDDLETNALFRTEYRTRKGLYTFSFERRYDLDNFSGTDERGFVKTWTSEVTAWRQLSQALTLEGSVEYMGVLDTDAVTADGETLPGELRDLEKKRWSFRAGGSWLFYEDMKATLRYTFVTLDATDDADSFDDHRIELNFVWTEDLL